jgi:hypothetical protein
MKFVGAHVQNNQDDKVKQGDGNLQLDCRTALRRKKEPRTVVLGHHHLSRRTTHNPNQLERSTPEKTTFAPRCCVGAIHRITRSSIDHSHKIKRIILSVFKTLHGPRQNICHARDVSADALHLSTTVAGPELFATKERDTEKTDQGTWGTRKSHRISTDATPTKKRAETMMSRQCKAAQRDMTTRNANENSSTREYTYCENYHGLSDALETWRVIYRPSKHQFCLNNSMNLLQLPQLKHLQLL